MHLSSRGPHSTWQHNNTLSKMCLMFILLISVVLKSSHFSEYKILTAAQVDTELACLIPPQTALLPTHQEHYLHPSAAHWGLSQLRSMSAMCVDDSAPLSARRPNTEFLCLRTIIIVMMLLLYGSLLCGAGRYSTCLCDQPMATMYLATPSGSS